MTETKAIVLTIAASVIAVLASTAALSAIGADPSVAPLVFLVILVAGADTCSRVVGHYSDEQ
jgi:hypothetical protein